MHNSFTPRTLVTSLRHWFNEVGACLVSQKLLDEAGFHQYKEWSNSRDHRRPFVFQRGEYRYRYEPTHNLLSLVTPLRHTQNSLAASERSLVLQPCQNRLNFLAIQPTHQQAVLALKVWGLNHDLQRLQCRHACKLTTQQNFVEQLQAVLININEYVSFTPRHDLVREQLSEEAWILYQEALTHMPFPAIFQLDYDAMPTLQELVDAGFCRSLLCQQKTYSLSAEAELVQVFQFFGLELS